MSTGNFCLLVAAFDPFALRRLPVRCRTWAPVCRREVRLQCVSSLIPSCALTRCHLCARPLFKIPCWLVCDLFACAAWRDFLHDHVTTLTPSPRFALLTEAARFPAPRPCRGAPRTHRAPRPVAPGPALQVPRKRLARGVVADIFISAFAGSPAALRFRSSKLRVL